MRQMKRMMWRLFLVLWVTIAVGACSELRSEFDPHKWRYAPYDTNPPSWENDMGRPGPGFGGDSW